jgi:hypothetical protein
MAALHDKLLEGALDREIAEKVFAAIDELFQRDAALFEVDANERSISHRLAQYLTSRFPEWDVDCEYNRDGHAPKRLLLGQPPVDAADTDGARVFPDIIVHHRTQADNLLVIELKKSTSNVSDEADHAKLRAFRDELGYRHGLFLCLASDTDNPAVVTATWYGRVGNA